MTTTLTVGEHGVVDITDIEIISRQAGATVHSRKPTFRSLQVMTLGDLEPLKY